MCLTLTVDSFVCVFFFKHTKAINSSRYQQCGHSKTEVYYQNDGQLCIWSFLTLGKTVDVAKAGG